MGVPFLIILFVGIAFTVKTVGIVWDNVWMVETNHVRHLADPQPKEKPIFRLTGADHTWFEKDESGELDDLDPCRHLNQESRSKKTFFQSYQGRGKRNHRLRPLMV